MIYTDENRGKIQNRQFRLKTVDYSGVRVKNITPTDIDGFSEFSNKGFIFCDLKYVSEETGHAKIPDGQRIAYERLITSLEASGKKAFFLICEHHEGDYDEIDAAASLVTSMYYGGRWHDAMEEITLSETYAKLHKIIMAQ